ncbi:MAG: helix-turn-helix domain-containing protein [Pirellulaceae bacterium]|nr:helix-turn-helix domain-containing protein [Pirellulaceae bacterium]
MAKMNFERISRPLTDEEKARHAMIRKQVMQEFPPAEKKQNALSSGIAADLRRARKARGFTCAALAELAGLPDANTVKDVEYGRNTELATIEAIAKALGLKLELVDA